MLTDLAQSVDAETIYSVGPHSTNVSIQQTMQNRSFDQSQAITVLFSAFAVLRESGWTGHVVIDAVDTDAYVVAAVLWQKLASMICIKRKQETIFCRGLLADEMAGCVVQLHCMTGCDANSSFYGKVKTLVNNQVAKNPVARRQLSWCGESLDLEEEVVEQYTRHVIYGGNKSSTIAEARATKWKRMNKKSFICLPPDADSQRQHYLRTNYLAYIMCHHGWELVDDRCRPVNTKLKWISTLICFH